MKFKNVKEKQTANEILKEGMKTRFWEIIVIALTESREALTKAQEDEALSELSPEVYKMQMELLRAKKSFIDNLIKTPENVMSWLQSPNNETQEFDPYAKEIDL